MSRYIREVFLSAGYRAVRFSILFDEENFNFFVDDSSFCFRYLYPMPPIETPTRTKGKGGRPAKRKGGKGLRRGGNVGRKYKKSSPNANINRQQWAEGKKQIVTAEGQEQPMMIDELGNHPPTYTEETVVFETDSVERAIHNEMYDRKKGLRMAIYYFFSEVFDFPIEEEWPGRDGIAADIARRLSNDGVVGTKVRPFFVCQVLSQIVEHLGNGIEYTGEQKVPNRSAKRLIGDDSPQMTIIADAMEAGFGITQTWEIVNQHRLQNGEEEVGRSCIYNAYLRLEPVVTPIKKRKQGSLSKDSEWAKARKELVLQFRI